MTKQSGPDFPFDEVVKGAVAKIKGGATVYQKFSCAKCGSRQTMSTPNKFFTEGTCQECGHTTNIRKRGCNYMLTMELP